MPLSFLFAHYPGHTILSHYSYLDVSLKSPGAIPLPVLMFLRHAVWYLPSQQPMFAFNLRVVCSLVRLLALMHSRSVWIVVPTCCKIGPASVLAAHSDATPVSDILNLSYLERLLVRPLVQAHVGLISRI